MKVAITLLAHNHSEMTLRCIWGLKEKTFYPYSLIFVDNGSDARHYKRVVHHIMRHWKEAIVIQNEENKFYAGGTNVGLKAAMELPEKPDLVVALSNDVFVSPGWLGKLVDLMKRNPKIGVLSPLTDNISRTCVNAEWVVKRWKILPRGSKDFRAINKLRSQFLESQGNIPLFCGMIRREVLEDVGYLFEEFFILGNDDDYNDRVRMAGWITAAALNVFVNHVHGATKHLLFPDRSEIRKRHRALLTERKAHRRATGDYRA